MKPLISNAFSLWLALEYLNPQQPPEVNPGTWRETVTAELDSLWPWVDRRKGQQVSELLRQATPARGRAPEAGFVLYAGILQAADIQAALERMLGAHQELVNQRPPRGQAASFVLQVDAQGHIDEKKIFVSALPWALARIADCTGQQQALSFSGFFGANGVQERLVSSIQAYCQDAGLLAGSNRRAVCAGDLAAIQTLVSQALGWPAPAEQLLAIDTQILFKGREEMSNPLNSLYAEEIDRVCRQYGAGAHGQALQQFLESSIRSDRLDLEAERGAVIAGLHPARLPSACWPSAYPLVTAQQFAVNTLLQELRDGGLFSVNGPPGTGKTTLLKDIIAEVICARARQLATFDDPKAAFGQEFDMPGDPSQGQYGRPRALHASLHGYGIAVTSANNGAVENISKELPGLGAIESGCPLDYFSQVADTMGVPLDVNDPYRHRLPEKRQSWGLISAVLGSKANRNEFAQNFFWRGRAKDAPPAAPSDPLSLPEWMKRHGHTLPSWADARRQFQQASQEVEAARQEAEQRLAALQELGALSQALAQLKEAQRKQLESGRDHDAQLKAAVSARQQAEQSLARAQAAAEYAQALVGVRTELQQANQQLLDQQKLRPTASQEQLETQIHAAQERLEAVREDLQRHVSSEPGFFKSLFQPQSKRRWLARQQQLEQELDSARQAQPPLKTALSQALAWSQQHAQLTQAARRAEAAVVARQASAPAGLAEQEPDPAKRLAEVRAAQARCTACASQVQSRAQAVNTHKTLCQTLAADIQRRQQRSADLQAALGPQAQAWRDSPNWNLAQAERSAFHQALPYQAADSRLFTARKALMVAAINLHKAFIQASWRPLQHNLKAFIGLLRDEPVAEDRVMDLWNSFFLVVPLVSTTFASLHRLFQGVGQEQLGWVLIDEAGQACPQQALGALWRAKRAVVVGDPLQLEPVVGIAPGAVQALVAYTQTDPRYVPPSGSVQTLADRSNRYGMYLGEDPEQQIWLGSPLVVHRRCSNPMFDIANQIAYDNKMVHGRSNAGPAELPSQWLDAEHLNAQSHWIPDQGQQVIALIAQLFPQDISADGKLQVYVITPFKRVAQQMRQLLSPIYGQQRATQMCGTVHTFQGREAAVVILLLGGDPTVPGIVDGFAGRSPNLLNVAVTRAKERLFVVGNQAFWLASGNANFVALHQRLQPAPATARQQASAESPRHSPLQVTT